MQSLRIGAILAVLALVGCQGAGLSQTPTPIVPETPGQNAVAPGAPQVAAPENDSTDDEDAPVTATAGPRTTPSQHPTVKPSTPASTRPAAVHKKPAAASGAAVKKRAHPAPSHHAAKSAKKKPKPSLSVSPT